jgi:hypothetical protein
MVIHSAMLTGRTLAAVRRDAITTVPDNFEMLAHVTLVLHETKGFFVKMLSH